MKIIQQSFRNEFNRYRWIESSQVLQFLYIWQSMRVPHDNLLSQNCGFNCWSHPQSVTSKHPSNLVNGNGGWRDTYGLRFKTQTNDFSYQFDFFPVWRAPLRHLLSFYPTFWYNNEISCEIEKRMSTSTTERRNSSNKICIGQTQWLRGEGASHAN